MLRAVARGTGSQAAAVSSGVWVGRLGRPPDEMKTSCFGSHYPSVFEPQSVFYLRASKESSVPVHENMKRRNANDGKRRPVKRTKISDNFLGRFVSSQYNLQPGQHL